MATNNKKTKTQSSSKTGSTKQTESSQSPTKEFIELMRQGVAKANRMSIEAEKSAKGLILGMR